MLKGRRMVPPLYQLADMVAASAACIYNVGEAVRERSMHLFQQHAVKDLSAAAAKIPVIDYGPYFAGEPGALECLAEKVRHACEDVGFLYVLNHGVPQEIVDRAFAVSRRFHALPLEEKLNLSLNENNIGDMPMNASVQAASQVHKATKPNQNESFFISHDRGPDHPDVQAGVPL